MPLSDGTLISAPSAASANVTGTVTVRLWPDRPNTGCGATCTRTYRSPAGPPRSPGAPLPLSLIRWPSPTPAGIRAWIVRVLIARPLPEHSGHGSSTTRPRPRQVLQGSENAKLPRFRLPWPVPSQVGHTLGTVPALAPVPLQALHGPSPASCSDTVAPSIASLKLSDASVSTSAPRRGRCGWVRPPPPNTPPSRSPSRAARAAAAAGRSRRTGRRGRSCSRRAAARAGHPDAAAEQRAGVVVLLAPLVVGQDVVGLGDLLEALLGRRVALVGVRVVLAGQLAV